MIYLLDKISILALCFFPFFDGEISDIEICALLLSLTVTFLGQALMGERKENKLRAVLKNALEIIYCVFCIVNADFLSFLPLAIYEAVRTKDYPSLSFGGIVLIYGFAAGFSPLYPLLVSVFSAYSCVKTANRQDLSRQMKKRRDDSAELEKIMRLRNRELEENLQYQLHINTLNERNRIAREIHDNVGHLLSRSLLQTGALSAICPKEQTALKSGLEDLKDSLNSAMNSIRESVHGIRDDSLDLKHESEKILAPLTEKFLVELDFDIEGEIPPKIKLCFISILKEAANNIIRHSSGDRVSVTLREHPSMYQLIVYDNGKASSPKITEGMGLSDMEEWAKAVGGNFRINSEKGFTVFISVKKEAV